MSPECEEPPPPRAGEQRSHLLRVPAPVPLSAPESLSILPFTPQVSQPLVSVVKSISCRRPSLSSVPSHLPCLLNEGPL